MTAPVGVKFSPMRGQITTTIILMIGTAMEHTGGNICRSLGR
ncbi:MAG: hypothetical protein ACR2M4_01815 [Actinomycetota bacterium]